MDRLQEIWDTIRGVFDGAHTGFWIFAPISLGVGLFAYASGTPLPLVGEVTSVAGALGVGLVGGLAGAAAGAGKELISALIGMVAPAKAPETPPAVNAKGEKQSQVEAPPPVRTTEVVAPSVPNHQTSRSKTV